MPATYLKKDLINLVRVEINRCLILNEAEKEQWTNELDKLPAVGLRNVLDLFRDNNSTVEGYISEALASKEGPSYATEIKNKLKKIQQKAFEIDESKKGVVAEEELTSKLKKI